VKQEKLDFLANNPFYTKRFGFYVGKRCSTSTVKDVAQELHLDRKTVKELEKQYMREKLRRAGKPNPKVIGIDEISIRKGHIYRIVVSDLEKRRPIWFGGKDRSEESMNLFYEWLESAKAKRIRLAVMDMWKPFEKSTRQKTPQASILYDKFHVIGHLNKALDKIRKSECARLTGKDRKFIKGQKYTLLSHRENLTTDGRKALTHLPQFAVYFGIFRLRQKENPSIMKVCSFRSVCSGDYPLVFGICSRDNGGHVGGRRECIYAAVAV